MMGRVDILIDHLIKSYVRRAGRSTSGQRQGWLQWDQWGLMVESGIVDPVHCFGSKAPLVIEIGFGMGESLASMAALESEKHFIGIEVHRSGVGALLNRIHTANLSNIRIYCDDAIHVLSRCISDHSLDRMQIYFPDPWPKRKHQKRRLIQPYFLDILRQKMKLGSVLHIATDWGEYAEYILQVCSNSPGWREEKNSDFGRPSTKFERRGVRLGYDVYDLYFKLFEKE
ncbi:MAG: tRNA (guanosine(46)-N7)-methyltransferase TrmB [Endozoicomonadaceae bacterium]|nr:tRNA (guanosine(46)-N7)-methyltransferase TrmB [Endozoicomonadaceae bacterium]